MVNISTVIVTFNRKESLVRCVQAVLKQRVKPKHLYIIDNASIDATFEYLVKNSYVSLDKSRYLCCNDTEIHYIRLEKNLGGAGGFHTGMKLALQNQPDFIWIMDDDGYPSQTCLETQLAFSGQYSYIMPISLDTHEKDRLTWFVRKKDKTWTRSYKRLKESFENGLMHHAIPFNGLLVSRELVETVGFPKKEMFIWGDDFEYQYRCIKTGYRPVTVLDAVFYHPEDTACQHRIFFNLLQVTYTDSRLRFTCLIRNSTYNYWHYKKKHFIVAKFFMYTWFFLINKKFDFKAYLYYLRCVKDGIKGDFSRHLKYIYKGSSTWQGRNNE